MSSRAPATDAGAGAPGRRARKGGYFLARRGQSDYIAASPEGGSAPTADRMKGPERSEALAVLGGQGAGRAATKDRRRQPHGRKIAYKGN